MYKLKRVLTVLSLKPKLFATKEKIAKIIEQGIYIYIYIYIHIYIYIKFH